MKAKWEEQEEKGRDARTMKIEMKLTLPLRR